MDYKLKKDVTINGMEFKSGEIVNIPKEMSDVLDSQVSNEPKKEAKKVSGKVHSKKKKEVSE